MRTLDSVKRRFSLVAHDAPLLATCLRSVGGLV
jgi:hypothetical protein